MNLTELGALMDRHGSAATLAEVATTPQADDAATLFEAMAQRMIPVPASYDHRLKAAQCLCGLLLEKLPRATTLHRTVLVLGKPHRTEFTLAWAHIAPGICSDCYRPGAERCHGHEGALCDRPEPEMCTACDMYPAALGGEVCHACARRAELAELNACGETLRETVRADRLHEW
jgi:hypothetical protein